MPYAAERLSPQTRITGAAAAAAADGAAISSVRTRNHRRMTAVVATAVLAREVRKEINSLEAERAEPLKILRGVNLEVAQGETIAIVGASGSGKTTLLSLLAGLDSPTAGEIHLA